MTGAQIKTLTTEILGGLELGDTLFYHLLVSAQRIREAERPWSILVKEDSSNSVTTANVYTTQHSLPTDIRELLSDGGVILIDPSNTDLQKEFVPILFKARHQHKRVDGRYYIDWRQSKIHLSGVIGRAYTMYLFYIYRPDELVAAGTWVFPSDYHRGLAYDVAAMHELGVDYDDITAPPGQAQFALGG